MTHSKENMKVEVVCREGKHHKGGTRMTECLEISFSFCHFWNKSKTIPSYSCQLYGPSLSNLFIRAHHCTCQNTGSGPNDQKNYQRNPHECTQSLLKEESLTLGVRVVSWAKTLTEMWKNLPGEKPQSILQEYSQHSKKGYLSTFLYVWNISR